MLCQFIVKNFKSIKDEIVLDMQATAISEHKESLIIDKDDEKFLPVAAIYGPNGSGKSNVLEALCTLVAKVMAPICSVCEKEDCSNKNIKMSTPTFEFNKKCAKQPTEFTVFFRTQRAEYRYVLKTLKEKILFESLDKKNIDGEKYVSLFEREGSQHIELYGSMKKLPKPEDISENIALISFLALTNRRNETVKEVISWFENGIEIANFANPFQEARVFVPNEKEDVELVTKIFQEMDIDIIDLKTVRENDEIEVYTKHIVDNESYELCLSEESAGTKKILTVLPSIIDSLSFGTVLCVDELDSKLHPVLIRYIIGLFTNRKINKKGAQLIFTSHDLANMNNAVYRRDEIWFIAKNNEQASNLYSLVELKDEEGNGIRKDARYDKQYLEGKYGADPYLKKIIDWGE